MTDWGISKPFDPHDLATGAVSFARRLLPGQVEHVDRVRVDVRVRLYDDVLELAPPTPAPWLQKGRLPVGVLLDCYV